MRSGSATPISAPTQERDLAVRLGEWLFKRRSWLPIPIVLSLVLLRTRPDPPALLWLGVALVAGGETIRLWAVHHIGVISRTRSDRLGPLISTGPFAHVRNPLYLGNVALWVGFTLAVGLLWLAPFVCVLLALEYHAIVRWEEELLLSRMGAPYRQYLGTVPRWIPRLMPAPSARLATSDEAPGHGGYSWLETLTSERSTLLAILLGFALVVGR
jgi:protein-S-isoprenylcysteine O-methyltransferase Ste14